MIDQEIQKFIDETKAAMDAAPNEAGPAFDAGLDSICAFIAPLPAADVHRWIQLLVAAYQSSNDKDQRERLQVINQKLATRDEFKNALARYHAWKDTKPTVLAARNAAERLASRIANGESIDDVMPEVLALKEQYVETQDNESSMAFIKALDTAREPAIDHRRENFRVFKERVVAIWPL